MKHKVIVAMSLVAAGVMTYLMFSGLDEGFYHFPWELFAGFGMMSWLIREGLKLVSDVKRSLKMKKAILYLFIGLSLEVWLVEMFTGWFDHAFRSPIHPWCLGIRIYDFYCLPMGKEWLKGEYHEHD